MHHSFANAVLVAAMLFGAGAVTPVSDSRMNDLLSAGGVDLALAASPMFFFGQAMGQPPCYPTAAFDDAGNKVAPGDGCNWPDAGCNCRNPGVDIGNEGPSFPVYYSYNKCADREIRVAYNLFYQKDGFTSSGHKYDWERVIVIWAQGSDSNWEPSRLLLSQHHWYEKLAWGDIQNTFDTADASEPRGGAGGRQNRDHAKVYVAWAPHAMYHTRKTGYNDVGSQESPNAFRSQDWWYYPTAGDFIRADDSTEVGQKLGSVGWGGAQSNPLAVHHGLCSQGADVDWTDPGGA